MMHQDYVSRREQPLKMWKSCWWNERKHEMKATNLYAVFRRIANSMGVNSDRPYGRSILADEELTWANSISSKLSSNFKPASVGHEKMADIFLTFWLFEFVLFIFSSFGYFFIYTYFSCSCLLAVRVSGSLVSSTLPQFALIFQL